MGLCFKGYFSHHQTNVAHIKENMQTWTETKEISTWVRKS